MLRDADTPKVHIAAMSVESASYGVGQSAASGLRSGYRIEPLNRLAFPKGKIPKCEISGQAASVACITPNVTLYYATEEQAEQAWHGMITHCSKVFTGGGAFVILWDVICKIYTL